LDDELEPNEADFEDDLEDSDEDDEDGADALTTEKKTVQSESAGGAKPPEKVLRAWYVVHSYSGYENKVKKNLEHRIESMGMGDLIFRVVVPTEEEVELRDGQRKTTERRIFPGYILVEMVMTDDSWYVVRNTPGVTGFVGSANEPTPLRQEEVDRILKRMEAETPKVKVSLKPGHKVRIVEGPFADFMGTVEELLLDKGKVRILVSFFGRETPVELDFLQVERI
jgi:transcriptional antiterminator NusG